MPHLPSKLSWNALLVRVALALPLVLAHAHAALSAQGPDSSMLAHAEPLAEDMSGRWVVVSNHNHTKASHDGRLTISQLAQEAAQDGIEAVVLTDHNSVACYDDPAFREPQPVTLIGGEEWSSARGHAGLIGLEDGPPLEEPMEVEPMLAAAGVRKGVAIVNHPFLLNLGWRSRRLEEGIQGVEVWSNYWGLPLMGNQRALEWWHEALAQGRRLTAVGGGDYHGHVLGGLARPVNLVWSRDASAASVVEGIRQGRVVVVSGSHGPRLDLAVDGARIGETLRLPAPQEATIRIRVQGGQGRTLSLIGPEGLLAKGRVEGGDATYELRRSFGAAGFVRAELRNEATVFQPMEALTNPVWVAVGAEALTAGR